jgi:NAD(P)-dependent dehydrogenase (short-subunit alcohol dehydrogenase family)
MSRVALITGVSSGIGRATAGALASAGLQTFGTVRGDVAPQPGVEHVRLDLRDPSSIEGSVREILDRAGRIDVLVNSAGTALVAASEETSIEEARALFETNFFGALRMTHAVLPAMRAQGYGRIVNLTSVLGFLPAPFMSLYAASKHALEGWSESLDHEVRGLGIRVLTVEPGFTRTGLGHKSAKATHALSDYRVDRERVAAAVARNIERGADPTEVARVVARVATAHSPRLHNQAGREARFLRLLRSVAPAAILDAGIRKSFGLGTLVGTTRRLARPRPLESNHTISPGDKS